MILVNSWGKYDRQWVIGDIRLAKNPNFGIQCGSSKLGTVIYEGTNAADKYMNGPFVEEFESILYSILNEHIEKGTDTLSCLELAVQYCMRLGLFDEQDVQSRIRNSLEEIKAMTEEKDGFRYREMQTIIGDISDDVSEKVIKFVTPRAQENLVRDHAAPKHVLPDDRGKNAAELYRNMRFAITRMNVFIFEELPTPSFPRV